MPVSSSLDVSSEIFVPVKGYEGAYEVSNMGTVRSVPRTVVGKDGAVYPYPGKTLAAAPNKRVEYMQVSLWRNNKGESVYVHRLVAEAFLPNPDNLPEVNHIDGCRTHNHVSNLEWATHQGNAQHAVNTGLKTYTNRLTKDEFVECLMSVIKGETYLALSKRVPYQVPFLSVKLRKIAQELGLEADLNEALRSAKSKRAKENGTKFLGAA